METIHITLQTHEVKQLIKLLSDALAGGIKVISLHAGKYRLKLHIK